MLIPCPFRKVLWTNTQSSASSPPMSLFSGSGQKGRADQGAEGPIGSAQVVEVDRGLEMHVSVVLGLGGENRCDDVRDGGTIRTRRKQ